MTTQVCNVQCATPTLSINYTATCTDDAWNEVVDETNSLSIGRVQENQTIYAVNGNYAAGAAIMRLRNLRTRDVREFLPCAITTEQKMMYLVKPLKIDRDDVLEVFCVEVPT